MDKLVPVKVYSPVLDIVRAVEPFTGDVDANITLDNIEKAAEVLARLRAAAKELKSLYDVAVKEHKDALKPYDQERLALQKKIDRMDESVERRLIDLYTSNPQLFRRLEGTLGSTITFVRKGSTITIEDAEQVPQTFVKPVPSRAERIDLAAIEAHIKATGRVPPGVSMTPTFYITTRAADSVTPTKRALK